MIVEVGEVTGLGFKEFDKELEQSKFFKKIKKFRKSLMSRFGAKK